MFIVLLKYFKAKDETLRLLLSVAPSLAGFCLLLASSFPKAEGRRQKAEGRRQKAEATFAVVKQGSAKKYKSESYEY
jgi:hypothetical protein